MVPKSAVPSAAVRDFSPTSATDGYRLGLLSGINTPQTIVNRGNRRHHQQSAITAPASSDISMDVPVASSYDVERKTIHRNEQLRSVFGQFNQQRECNKNAAVGYGDSLGVVDDDDVQANALLERQNMNRQQQQHRVSARSRFNGRLTRSNACFNIAEACNTFCQPSDVADYRTFSDNFADDSGAISTCQTGCLTTCPRDSSVSSEAMYANHEPTAAVGTCRRRWKDLPTDNREFSPLLSSMAPVRSNDDTPPHPSPRPIHMRSSAVATTKIRQKRLAQKPTSLPHCQRCDCSDPLSPMSNSLCISNDRLRTDTTAKPVKCHMLPTAQQQGADKYVTSSARDDKNKNLSSLAATGARPKSVSRPKHNSGNRLQTYAHVRPFKPCELPVSCDAACADDHTNVRQSRRCAIPRPLRSKTTPLTTVTCDPIACCQLKSDNDSFGVLTPGCRRPAAIAGRQRPRTGPLQQNRNYEDEDRDLTFAVDIGGGLETSAERWHQRGPCSGSRIAKRFPGTSDHFLQRSGGLDRVHKNDAAEAAGESAASWPNSSACNVDTDFQKFANDPAAVPDNRKVAKLMRRPSTPKRDRLISDRSHQSILPMPEAPIAHQPRISPFGCSGQVGSHSDDDEYCPTWSTAAVPSELETDGSGDWYNSSAQGGLPSDKAASYTEHWPVSMPSHHGRSSIRQSSKSAFVVPTPRSIGSFLVNYVYPSFRAFLIWSFSSSAKLAAWFKASVLDLVKVILEQFGQVINDPERELLWHHLESVLDDWHLFAICLVLLAFFVLAVGVVYYYLTD